MLMPYFNRVVRGPFGKGVLEKTNDSIRSIVKDRTIPHYISNYNYEIRHKDEFDKNSSVAGIVDVTTRKLMFDMDNGVNLPQAHADTIKLVERLVDEHKVPLDKVRIFFSGKKGFHVELITNHRFGRPEVTNMVLNLGKDLASLDVKILDEARVMRVPLTAHQDTKLYKIPLTREQLQKSTVREIMEKAETPDGHEYGDAIFTEKNFTFDLPATILELKDKYIKPPTPALAAELTGLKFDIEDIDFTQCHKGMSKERYALSEGFFWGSGSAPVGQRHHAFMILAATWKSIGLTAQQTLEMLKITAIKQADRTKETVTSTNELQQTVINSVFSPTWTGGVYGLNDPLLQYIRDQFGIPTTTLIRSGMLTNIQDVAARFKVFAAHIDQNTIKTGIAEIDSNVLITTGMMVGVLGAPSSGKTSFANTFVENLSKQDIPVIYHSLDMWDNLLCTRLLQKHTGYDMRHILKLTKEMKEDKKLADAWTEVIKSYGNVSFNFRSGPTVEDIEEDVVTYTAEHGLPPKLVVVDYLEKVRGPYADATANSAYVASRLSDVAKTHDTCVLLLLQPQKAAGDPREELINMRKVKGASVIEQDCRVILTVWRPGFNPKDATDDRFTSVAVVKNNMGGCCTMDFGWDGVTGTLKKLDEEGRRDLQALRKNIETQRLANDRLAYP